MPGDTNTLEPGKLSITFNYDRSFERYFLNTLEGRFGLVGEEANRILNRIRVKHVYGQLGTLDEVPYGDYSKAQEAAKHVDVIRSDVDVDKQKELEPLIRQSLYVNFIGFGFDEDNIKLLGPKNFRGRRIYSTSVRLGSNTRRVAEKLGVQFDDVLAVYKLDRLGRSLQHLAQLIGELEAHGTALVASSQGIDTSDSNPAGRLQMHVLAAVAEFERSVIVERINAGLAAARARGATLGRPRTLDRHHAAVAKLNHRGLSGRKIAAKLNIPAGSVFSVIKSVRTTEF